MAFTATRPGPGPGDPPFVGGAVGHLSYDWATQLEPVPLPPAHPDDAGLPLMRFMLADSVVAFDHVRRTMSLIGPRKAVERLVVALSKPPAAAGCAPAGGRRAQRDHARALHGGRRDRARAHRRRRCVPDRPLPARPPRDRGLAVRDLPGAARRQPVALHVPAGQRRVPAGRLLARGARPARPGRHLRAAADRGHAAALGRPHPGRRPGRGAACLREGPGRARDAGRPGPQRPGPRVPAGQHPGGALDGGRALLARHAHRLERVRAAARRPGRGLAAARDLPGGHAVGRAQGAGDADHLGAGGPAPRRLRRRHRLPRLRRRHGHLHRDPHDRHARRRRVPAGGGRDRGRLRPCG